MPVIRGPEAILYSALYAQRPDRCPGCSVVHLSTDTVTDLQAAATLCGRVNLFHSFLDIGLARKALARLGLDESQFPEGWSQATDVFRTILDAVEEDPDETETEERTRGGNHYPTPGRDLDGTTDLRV